jgi:hypothetical protein
MRRQHDCFFKKGGEVAPVTGVEYVRDPANIPAGIIFAPDSLAQSERGVQG